MAKPRPMPEGKKLTEMGSSILRVLDGCRAGSGFMTKRVSERADHPYCRGNNRQRSGAIRAHLVDLLRSGHVRLLDNEKPDVWVITELGRRALNGESDET